MKLYLTMDEFDELKDCEINVKVMSGNVSNSFVHIISAAIKKVK